VTVSAGEALTGSDVTRDRWGRPLITPPGGGKPVAYTRVTTLAKTLEDQSALTSWKQRMTLEGASLRPDIVTSAAAHRGDKAQLNKLCEQAMDAAQAGAKATIGTALHKILEKIDLGQDPGPVPEQHHADIRAYRELMVRTKLRIVGCEVFLVLDDLQVAGTTDRILQAEDGTLIIGDLKTGSIEYGGLSISCQLACYSNGLVYDPATGQRQTLAERFGGKVNEDLGYVIHLPSGEGRAELVEADLAQGWQVAFGSLSARAWRKDSRKWLQSTGLKVDANAVPQVETLPLPAAEPAGSAMQPVGGSLSLAIQYRSSLRELNELWRDFGVEATDADKAAAKTRHSELCQELADRIASVRHDDELVELWQEHGAWMPPDLVDLVKAQHTLINAI